MLFQSTLSVQTNKRFHSLDCLENADKDNNVFLKQDGLDTVSVGKNMNTLSAAFLLVCHPDFFAVVESISLNLPGFAGGFISTSPKDTCSYYWTYITWQKTRTRRSNILHRCTSEHPDDNNHTGPETKEHFPPGRQLFLATSPNSVSKMLIFIQHLFEMQRGEVDYLWPHSCSLKSC